ncbi:MAG: hypothetical protein ABID64_02950 [Nitrospirota bacterium]
MENAIKIAEIAGPALLLMGLSILLHAKAWQRLADKWQKDHLSLFPIMLLTTLLGLVVIGMYNVWEFNVWLIVTVLGWAMLVKGVVYFLIPGSALKGVVGLGKNLGLLYVGGLVWAVAGAALGYYAYFA